MTTAATLPQLQRDALREAHRAESQSLVRSCGGFRADIGPDPDAPKFTLRLVRILERGWLVEFDDSAFPSRATLTKKGAAIATELAAEQTPQAGAA